MSSYSICRLLCCVPPLSLLVMSYASYICFHCNRFHIQSFYPWSSFEVEECYKTAIWWMNEYMFYLRSRDPITCFLITCVVIMCRCCLGCLSCECWRGYAPTSLRVSMCLCVHVIEGVLTSVVFTQLESKPWRAVARHSRRVREESKLAWRLCIVCECVCIVVLLCSFFMYPNRI